MTITDMPVMASCCPTCPFGPHGDRAVREMVEARCVAKSSQVCHHPRLHGREETHLCRGARNHQLTVFYRLGVIDAPTDEAWAAKRKELGV